jgi:hypothetical protein
MSHVTARLAIVDPMSSAHVAPAVAIRRMHACKSMREDGCGGGCLGQRDGRARQQPAVRAALSVYELGNWGGGLVGWHVKRQHGEGLWLVLCVA